MNLFEVEDGNFINLSDIAKMEITKGNTAAIPYKLEITMKSGGILYRKQGTEQEVRDIAHKILLMLNNRTTKHKGI